MSTSYVEEPLVGVGQGRVGTDYLPKGEPLAASVMPEDNVNHPSHYNSGTIEVIDAIESVMTSMKGAKPIWIYLTGQVLKYLMRWYLKSGKEDLQKAAWYLERLIKNVGDGR